MSVPILGQVYDEIRRLTIAGSIVVPGDFRIKKLIPTLEQAAKKSPVFGKVLEGVQKLADATEKNASEALLELGTLVNAILYTQGETGADGEFETIASKSFGVHKTQVSARSLKPVLEALSSTGSGRLEILRDARDRNLFYDLRLIRPAIVALDDSYSEIADMIAGDVLPMYGDAIVPELQSQLDLKGRGGHARRLSLMHRLAPNVAREYVKKALEEGSKEVRLAAIECLGIDDEDLEFLLAQSKGRSKDIRQAAVNGLCQMLHSEVAAEAICKAIDSADLFSIAPSVSKCSHPTVLNHLMEELNKNFDAVISGNVKDRKELGTKIERLIHLLRCFDERQDPETQSMILKLYAGREALAKLKAEPGGQDMIEQIVYSMARGSISMKRVLVDGHAELSDRAFEQAFLVACQILKPEEVYTLFCPYLLTKVDEKKKGKDPAYAKRQILIDVIANRNHSLLPNSENSKPVAESLDPKWLDLAISINHPELIAATAIEGNKKSNDALSKIIEEKISKAKEIYDVYEFVNALARVGHPQLVDVVVNALEKQSKSTHVYALYWIGQFIPRLPKETAVPRLEALIPKFSGRVQDQLVDYILELKAK